MHSFSKRMSYQLSIPFPTINPQRVREMELFSIISATLLLQGCVRAMFGEAADALLRIQMAAKNGHVDVIRQFLKDKRVDQTIVRSTLLWEASRNGHLDVFRLLMDEGRSKPSIFFGFLLLWIWLSLTDLLREL